MYDLMMLKLMDISYNVDISIGTCMQENGGLQGTAGFRGIQQKLGT